MLNLVSKQRQISSDMDVDEQTANLSSLISNPPQNSRVVQFSPELATYVLDNLNVGNRSKKPKQIKEYADDMTINNWSLTGVPIVFGSHGMLLDGQNRLSACVRANKPFMTHCVFGVDSNSFVHFDVGKKRTNADIFTIMGVPYPRETGLAIRLISAWESGDTDARSIELNHDQMRSTYNEKMDSSVLELCIKKAKAVNKHTTYPVAHLIALMYLAWKQGHSEKVKCFMADLEAGYGKGVRSPVRLLLNTVARMRMDRTQSITSHMYSIMLIRTWNNYLAGKASIVADMKVGLDDAFPLDTTK
tara:strand:+ start:1093 stop:2001 length:909 start_codon:yes stop_codon:yes gene_type:complete